MAIQSMTGFARIEGQFEDTQWVWEVRSVNGKGLDFRLRTPPRLDALQPKIRKLLTKKFSRGNLQINLTLERQDDQHIPVVNHLMLDAVVAGIKQVQDKIDCSQPAAEQILAIKGVLEPGSAPEDEEQEALLIDNLLVDFQKLTVELEVSRQTEGAATVEFLLDQLQQIENHKNAIVSDPSRSLEQIKSHLNAQVARLLDNTSGLDLDRVHQEAAILAAKADLQEELDRLSAHVDSARDMLNSNGPIGRKLDFLCQEFNRECNTICSKSNAATVTAIGLDMKVVIDQLREQVQNIE